MEQREIKFRVWDGEDCRMSLLFSFADYAIHFNQDYVPIQFAACKPERFKFLQFTGLKDKNGKEIYEGDIVKTIEDHFCALQTDWCAYSAGEVKWIREGFSIRQQFTGANSLHYYQIGEPEEVNAGLEIIGNIFENPELLKKENKLALK